MDDLRPFIEKRDYSLIIGHSLGALTALALSAHLPSSHPTAIILVDPPLQATPKLVSLYDNMFSEACANPKSAEAHSAENPVWKREDVIFRELGLRLCSVDMVHGVLEVRTVLVGIVVVLIST